MQSSTSEEIIDASSTPIAYIASHKGIYRKKYQNNLDNELIFNNLQGINFVTFDYPFFVLGSHSSCIADAMDVLIISSSDRQTILYPCGDTKIPPPRLTINTTTMDSLTLTFKTNNKTRYDGFLLRYSGNNC